MSRNKTEKFKINEASENIIQAGKPIFDTIKGNWNEFYFKNNNKIVLEIACGKGDYAIGLAELFTDKNFIGIDIKGARLWKGSTVAKEKGLTNIAFLRTRMLYLEDFFAPGEVAEIWITFPDPRPRDRDEKRRLTHARFIEIYKRIITPGGTVHLKTDNQQLFEFTLEELEKLSIVPDITTFDLYKSPYLDLHHGIQTFYEKLFLEEGLTIKYLNFKFN